MSAYSVRQKETKVDNNEKVEVLYQRIGTKWYAFTEENDEVFFTEVPEDAITQAGADGDGPNCANS